MIHQYQLGGYNIVLDVCSGAVKTSVSMLVTLSGMAMLEREAQL